MNSPARQRVVMILVVVGILLALVLVAFLTMLWARESSVRDTVASSEHSDIAPSIPADAAPAGDDRADTGAKGTGNSGSVGGQTWTTTAPPEGSGAGSGSDSEARYSYDLFQSPSGNIHCQIGGQFSGSFGGTHELKAACLASKFNGTDPKPDCSGGGSSFAGAAALTVDGGAVQGMCAGGQPFDYGTTSPSDIPVLAYGESTSNGQVTCTSRESGMLCTDLADGGQFALSRSNVSRGR